MLSRILTDPRRGREDLVNPDYWVELLCDGLYSALGSRSEAYKLARLVVDNDWMSVVHNLAQLEPAEFDCHSNVLLFETKACSPDPSYIDCPVCKRRFAGIMDYSQHVEKSKERAGDGK